MVTTVEFKPLMQDRILVQLQMATEIAPPEQGEAEGGGPSLAGGDDAPKPST